jgi:hypothetical protein
MLREAAYQLPTAGWSLIACWASFSQASLPHIVHHLLDHNSHACTHKPGALMVSRMLFNLVFVRYAALL